jgi:hypothetical protein
MGASVSNAYSLHGITLDIQWWSAEPKALVLSTSASLLHPFTTGKVVLLG